MATRARSDSHHAGRKRGLRPARRALGSARSCENAMGEPPCGGHAALGFKNPNPIAIGGFHAPVVARARTPGGIIEPPFRRNAFGTDGRRQTTLLSSPDKGLRRRSIRGRVLGLLAIHSGWAGRHGGVGLASRLWAGPPIVALRRRPPKAGAWNFVLLSSSLVTEG